MLAVTQFSRNSRIVAAFVVLLGLVALAPSARGDISQTAVNNAHAVLKDKGTGEDMLAFIHLGATYHGHTYVKTCTVTDRPNDFALVYRFNWDDDGVTDVAVLCNKDGAPYDVQILNCNGVIQQPFSIANLTIQVVGKIILDNYGDKMSTADRATVKEAITNADSKVLLVWYLKLRTL